LDDPGQFESLLDPVQLWANGIFLDLCAVQFRSVSGELGRQGMSVNGEFYPFEFDGQQLYFRHRYPSTHELDTLPMLTLTSGDPTVYPLPESRRHSLFRRTTSTVKILRRQRLPKEELARWKGRLCFLPDPVILKTLASTTQLVANVEAENRAVPRKHLISRLLPLRHRRIREHVATDWFHVTTLSVNSHRGFQLYVGQRSKTLFPYCLRRKAHMVDSLLEFCREIGIPEKLIMDGDGAQNNPEVTRVVNEYLIATHNSEPENQQQNWAERGGATVKLGLRRLQFETRFDLAYWNYAVVHYCDCFNHTASRELGWRCRLEYLHGPTQDISVFRFIFWSLVWFWDPHIKFPASQWRLGRFLGRTKNVGDPFTIWIKPVRRATDLREPVVVARSVVRECVDPESEPPDANDCVDYPVADLILPSRNTPSVPLDPILEEEDMTLNGDQVHHPDAPLIEPVNPPEIINTEERLISEQIFPETVELDDCVDGPEAAVRPLDDYSDSEELFPPAKEPATCY
jgi:hypothetical protein